MFIQNLYCKTINKLKKEQSDFCIYVLLLFPGVWTLKYKQMECEISYHRITELYELTDPQTNQVFYFDAVNNILHSSKPANASM